MASSSSVSSQGSQKYDVFLNFRGKDVRLNFLSHLIPALKHASLNYFVDYKLKRGEHIKSELMDAIQDSKVSLTIFSEGYASSAWCLDELVKIMDCRENPTLKQKVIPVFYHVTPSDVRNVQRGVFAQDFAKHESDHRSRSKVPRWKAAMEAAGSLSGRIVNETSSEAHVLIQIVDDILTILGRNMTSVSSQGSQKYDVFLHFRGEDVHCNFLGYLIEALNDASLNIFVDYELERGEDIKSALKDAIQDSKVALTIFSEGYASSSWALDELVKIMECRKNPTLNQKVIPVFYHVDPSDVRKQSGVFAQDFANYKRDYGSSRVQNWSNAMKAAGDLSGIVVEKTRSEVDVTMQIVKDVLKFLRREPPMKISPRELRDNPQIQQQQRNGLIWTIPPRLGIQVQDLDTVLKSIGVPSSRGAFQVTMPSEIRDDKFTSFAANLMPLCSQLLWSLANA